MKNWITIGLSASLLSSCAPWPEPPRGPGDPYFQGANQGTPTPGPGNVPPPAPVPKPQPNITRPTPEPTPPPAPKPKYPTATSIPGKDGHVFNPYTNDPVDVRGIPSGSLVTDPNDDESRKFRVP